MLFALGTTRSADENPVLRKVGVPARQELSVSAIVPNRYGCPDHRYKGREKGWRIESRLLFPPSSRPCPPPASGWLQPPPSTAGTASWHVRSTVPALLQAVPGEPTCAPPPPAAGDTLHTPRSSATHEPAEASPPADEASPSGRCPSLSPHTALAAGTVHRPQPRTRRLSTGGCAPFCRCGYPSGTPSGSYVRRGRCRSPMPGLSRSPPWPQSTDGMSVAAC